MGRQRHKNRHTVVKEQLNEAVQAETNNDHEAHQSVNATCHLDRTDSQQSDIEVPDTPDQAFLQLWDVLQAAVQAWAV